MSDKHRKRKPKDGSLDLKRSGIRLSKYVDYVDSTSKRKIKK